MKTIKAIPLAFIIAIMMSCNNNKSTSTTASSTTTDSTSTTTSDKKDTSNLMAQVAQADDPVLTIPSTPEVQHKGDYIAAKTAGILAYEWGYALLRMEKTMREYINVPNPKPATSYRAPLNTIGWATKLPTADDKDMPSANHDTYYLSAVVDLTQPYIIKTPDTKDRYYVIDVFDMYQNLLDYIGRRTTGTAAGTFAIVPPGWKGSLPAGIKKVIKATTPKVWLWGRISILEGEDPAIVHNLQDQFKLLSLSEFEGKGSIGKSTSLPPIPDFPKTDSLRFYKQLAFAMKNNPIPEDQKALVGQFEKIGLTPGNFDPSKLNADQKRGLYDATLDGPLTIIASIQSSAAVLNGWAWVTKLDDFGYNYALRSIVSGPYLGGQGEKEAMYPIRYTDSEGKVLDGNNTYVMKFDKEPPVNAFWSVTMYDAKTKLFVANDLNRYKISTDSKGLKKNADGSFEIIMQHAKPSNTDNWLPAPDGAFYLLFRMYQPKPEVLNGTYKLPNVVIKK